MRENFDIALRTLFDQWGAFADHPSDPGGMTNLGVTRHVWERWVGREVPESEMRALTPELVTPMFKATVWDAVGGDELPSGVDVVVFDLAVNSGPRYAVQVLQKLLGAELGGLVTPDMLSRAASADPRKLISDYTAERLAYLRRIPFWSTSGEDWTKRVAAVQAVADSLVV